MWKSEERLNLISELRCRLAEVSVEMLEPDLIILDEFQRFKELLDHQQIQRRSWPKLFRYKESRLFSFLPPLIKCSLWTTEQEDDHYGDFLKTLRFLYDSDAVIEELKEKY